MIELGEKLQGKIWEDQFESDTYLWELLSNLPNGYGDGPEPNYESKKQMSNLTPRKDQIDTDILMINNNDDSIDLTHSINYKISINSLLILGNLWCGGSKQDKAEVLFRMIKT
jgi:hypothetical protein